MREGTCKRSDNAEGVHSGKDVSGSGIAHWKICEVMDTTNPIVVIGTVAFDSVKTPFGEAPEVLGGSATFFAMAARLFTKVRLVAIVGRGFPPRHLRTFERAGVDLAGLVRAG